MTKKERLILKEEYAHIISFNNAGIGLTEMTKESKSYYEGREDSVRMILEALGIDAKAIKTQLLDDIKREEETMKKFGLI